MYNEILYNKKFLKDNFYLITKFENDFIEQNFDFNSFDYKIENDIVNVNFKLKNKTYQFNIEKEFDKNYFGIDYDRYLIFEDKIYYLSYFYMKRDNLHYLIFEPIYLTKEEFDKFWSILKNEISQFKNEKEFKDFLVNKVWQDDYYLFLLNTYYKIFISYLKKYYPNFYNIETFQHKDFFEIGYWNNNDKNDFYKRKYLNHNFKIQKDLAFNSFYKYISETNELWIEIPAYILYEPNNLKNKENINSLIKKYFDKISGSLNYKIKEIADIHNFINLILKINLNQKKGKLNWIINSNPFFYKYQIIKNNNNIKIFYELTNKI